MNLQAPCCQQGTQARPGLGKLLGIFSKEVEEISGNDRVYTGVGFRVQGLGFRVQRFRGLGFRGLSFMEEVEEVSGNQTQAMTCSVAQLSFAGEGA